jgi:hypothetical protein
MYIVIDMPTLTVVSEHSSLFEARLAANSHVGSREGHTFRDYLNASKGAYVIRQRKSNQEIAWTTWGGAAAEAI